MTVELVIAFTILLFLSLYWALLVIQRWREKKYHREYMREWRKKRRIKELRELRAWQRQNSIKVKNPFGASYLIGRR